MGRLVNHVPSHRANLTPIRVEVLDRVRVGLVTKRRVSQLSWDYGMRDRAQPWTLHPSR